MRDQDWKNLWKAENAGGSYAAEPPPWDYRAKVLDFLKPGTRLLDMAPGDGEFLLSLEHEPGLTAAVEGREPWFELCQKRLAPLGISVKKYAGAPGEEMPFPDGSFDLILNRQAPYDVKELWRVLAPGGFFLTQQAGGQNSRFLAKRLLPEKNRPGMDFNLENELPKFRSVGFRIMYRNQAYPVGRFTSLNVLRSHAESFPELFPGFSAEACLPQLLSLQRELEQRGFLENQEHWFILIAKKRS